MGGHGSLRIHLSLDLLATMVCSMEQMRLSTRNDVTVSAFPTRHLQDRIEGEALDRYSGSQPTSASFLQRLMLWLHFGLVSEIADLKGVHHPTGYI